MHARTERGRLVEIEEGEERLVSESGVQILVDCVAMLYVCA